MAELSPEEGEEDAWLSVLMNFEQSSWFSVLEQLSGGSQEANLRWLCLVEGER